MREVDRLMIEEYGIGLPQMMENAGRNLARLAAGPADARYRIVTVADSDRLAISKLRRDWITAGSA
jgi:NAD(P)H-hydrate repair Nnr-like enzyme with NAD(P)H-hydrate epimerase domain